MDMDASKIMDMFSEFLENEMQSQLLESIRKKDSLKIDFSKLAEYNIELSEELLNNPEDTLKAFELACQKFDPDFNIRVRFYNLPNSSKILIRNIRSKDLGKFIVVDGVIKQKTTVHPQVVSAKFECPSCGNIIVVNQDENVFKKPEKCTCGRKGKFRLIDKKLIDAQKIVLEESPDDLSGGAQPKQIAVYLKEDLVSPFTEIRTNPGTKVRVYGICRDLPHFTNRGVQSITYDVAVFGNNIEPIEEDFTDINIDEKEVKEILELSRDPRIFDKLRESIAPSIYGHEKIKDALLLQLFGGVRKVRKDGIITRGDTHILLIGDPGSGKSQLIKRISIVAPKARYVSGKGVSGAGLTATVVRDDFGGGWILEAGALVLANKGYCMIDEMDK